MLDILFQIIIIVHVSSSWIVVSLITDSFFPHKQTTKWIFMNSSAEASQEEVIVKDLRSVILGHESAEPDQNCLICQIENANWVIQLQDVLENHGVSVEDFADASGNYFIVKRGRLRMKHDKQCMYIPKISEMLDDLIPIDD